MVHNESSMDFLIKHTDRAQVMCIVEHAEHIWTSGLKIITFTTAMHVDEDTRVTLQGCTLDHQYFTHPMQLVHTLKLDYSPSPNDSQLRLTVL